MNHPRTQSTLAQEPTLSRIPKATRDNHGYSFLRLRKLHLGLGAMAFAGVMVCIPALPASAEVVRAVAVKQIVQSLVVAPMAATTAIERAEYSIQWFTLVQSPVAPGTTVSSGFGYRIAPCAECSSYHEGVDWLPGAGTPVLAIADGVVTDVGNPSGSLGVYVTIQHVVDGQAVFSTYGHLGSGSMPYAIGSTVARGEPVGVVGSTGTSTGPHLYFQIRLANGAAVNPLPWLTQHINV